MSTRQWHLLPSVLRLLLATISLSLPRSERDEWISEWRAELHHILGCGVRAGVCIAFAVGAVPDALCIRRHSLRTRNWLESPRRCLGVLVVYAGLNVTLALLFPQVRQDIFPPKYDEPDDLVTISPVPSVVGSEMEVPAAQYLAWNSHAQPELSQTAFYRPTTLQAQVGTHLTSWSLGESTETLAALLKVQVSDAITETCTRTGSMPILLSRDAWRRDFAADPNVVGHRLRIAGRPAVIVGVAPPAASDLPLQMDAWSLESGQAIHNIASKRFAYGYMIAQLAPGSVREASHRTSRIKMVSDGGVQTRLYVIGLSSLAEYHRRIPTINFLLSLFMTCLMLPAILAVCLRSRLRTERLSVSMRSRGWIFLVAKIALLLPMLFCGPLLIAHAAVASSRDARYDLQTLVTVCACLMAVFWIVDDQRQRCPRCLRMLRNPARVGERSRSLLSFSGMEYVCSEGHGLLHVPDYPTSWFASQRWLALDSSWRILFQHGR
jgi:hypothetical protein